MEINLEVSEAPTRENRLGSISGYCGTLRDAAQKSSCGRLGNRERCFNQTSLCNAGCAQGMVCGILDAAVVNHAPVGCTVDAIGASVVRKYLGMMLGFEPRNAQFVGTNLNENDTVFGAAAKLRAAITDKTRLIFINSPSNPSGVAYNLDELKALGDVLADFPNIIIATDDMYEHILWNQGTFVNILNAHPEFYDRTVVMNGVSKAYSMTGWRIGYAAGPADLIEAMCTIQSQSTSNPTSISQYAAEAALTGDQTFITDMCVEFKKRHDYVVAELNSIDGIECLETDGTFYVFPNVEKLIARLDGINNDLEFSDYLIEKAGVALVPGSAFGTEGHIRISIATSMANLEKALERIKNAI